MITAAAETVGATHRQHLKADGGIALARADRGFGERTRWAVIFAADARGPERGDAGAFGIVTLDAGRDLAERCAEEGMTPGQSVTRLDGDYTGTRRESELERARKPL